MVDVLRINDYLKGAITMTKINIWELVNKEASVIIKAIEKGEIKTRKEYHDYLNDVYNWNISDHIETLVNVYLRINHIDIDWDNETTETAE